jgi:hypothetical protein
VNINAYANLHVSSKLTSPVDMLRGTYTSPTSPNLAKVSM